MSNETEYGDVESLAMVVHAPPLEGLCWKATESIPDPPLSFAAAESEIVPRRSVPGSEIELVGAAESDLTTFALVATVTLPALSAIV